jgi:hypothetical protein
LARERGIEVHRDSGRREEGRDIIRWCFADLKMAADFAAAFGGIVRGRDARSACRHAISGGDRSSHAGPVK